jgi:hypothetical protein
MMAITDDASNDVTGELGMEKGVERGLDRRYVTDAGFSVLIGNAISVADPSEHPQGFLRFAMGKIRLQPFE